MADLLADENLPNAVVQHLNDLGHDVLTILAAGLAEQRFPDEAVLQYATAANRGVVTLNRKDFIKLHTVQPQHAGIIVCTFDLDFRALALRVHEVILQNDTLQGRLLRVQKPNVAP